MRSRKLTQPEVCLELHQMLPPQPRPLRLLPQLLRTVEPPQLPLQVELLRVQLLQSQLQAQVTLWCLQVQLPVEVQVPQPQQAILVQLVLQLGGGAETTITSSVSTITTPAVTGSTTDKTGDLQLLLGQFLEAQKRVMVQAAAAQNLPTLQKFSGEDSQDDDNSFSRWHELFKERALLTGWTPEQKLCQLKTHLEKTALEVFRMMPESERTKYETAVGALKKRF